MGSIEAFQKELEELQQYKKAFLEKATIIAPHGSTMTGVYTLSDSDTVKELIGRLDAALELAESRKNMIIDLKKDIALKAKNSNNE